DLLRSPELVGDVGRRDRAEEGAGRARLHLEAQLGLRQLVGDLLRLLYRPRLVARALRLALLQLCDLRGCRGFGEPPRKEKVPRVAARDVDDLPAQPDLLDVAEENDVHQPVT